MRAAVNARDDPRTRYSNKVTPPEPLDSSAVHSASGDSLPENNLNVVARWQRASGAAKFSLLADFWISWDSVSHWSSLSPRSAPFQAFRERRGSLFQLGASLAFSQISEIARLCEPTAMAPYHNVVLQNTQKHVN